MQDAHKNNVYAKNENNIICIFNVRKMKIGRMNPRRKVIKGKENWMKTINKNEKDHDKEIWPE